MKNFLITMICGFIAIPAVTALALSGHHVVAAILACGGVAWLAINTWRMWRPSR